MSHKAIFARWTLVGIVAGVGLVGLHDAIGQATKRAGEARPKVVVDGREYQGTFDRDAWPKLLLKLEVTGKTEGRIELVRVDFKGNPASRVVRLGDTDRKVVSTRPFTCNGKTTVKTFDFGKAEEAGEKVRRSYNAILRVAGKDHILDSIAAPPDGLP